MLDDRSLIHKHLHLNFSNYLARDVLFFKTCSQESSDSESNCIVHVVHRLGYRVAEARIQIQFFLAPTLCSYPYPEALCLLSASTRDADE